MMFKRSKQLLLILACYFATSLSAIAQELLIDFPLECQIGEDCFFTNLVMHKNAEGASVDFRCGNNTYEGHSGTDIAVKDYSANVAVLAPIEGTVMGVRNSMPDEMLSDDLGLLKVKGKECGNGLVLKQGHYKMQLCHLKQGSIRVKVGEVVKAGQKVGVVGLSGKTYFPHLHLSLDDMSDDKAVTIDPFYGRQGLCGKKPESIWRNPNMASEIQAGEIFALGPAPFKPNKIAAILGEYNNINIPQNSKILTAWVGAYFVKKGDLLKLKIYSPNGRIFASRKKYFNKDYAQYFMYAGRRNKSPLKKGSYKIVAEYKQASSRLTNTKTKEFTVK